MHLHISIVALIWGTLSGYAMLRSFDSLLAVIFCLHSLLINRWKQLINRAAPGQIPYDIILNQLFKAGLLGLLFVYALKLGDNIAWNEFRFTYQGNNGLLWAASAGIIAILFLRTT